MASIHQKGSTPVFLARITNTEQSSGDNLVPLDTDTITSAKYTIYRKSTAYGGVPYTAMPGHVDIDIPDTCFLETLQMDQFWTADAGGYNFRFSPNTRDGTHPFETAGVYEIRFVLTRTFGNPIVWNRILTFV